MVAGNLAYFELQPAFSCLYSDQWKPCQATDFCSTEQKYQIDYTAPTSLHNWVQQLSLECASRPQISHIASFYFVGWVFGALFLPRMSEVWGRRPVFLIVSAG
jgi:hypothetical protein